MDPTRRFFAREMLELRVRRSTGVAFETLFAAIMQRRYKDYRKLEPYGNVGDRKNDGYIPKKGSYFQLFAPKDPATKVSAAAKKAKDDFKGLKQHWHKKCPIREYRFVFNDNYGGTVVPLEDALNAIAKSHKIKAVPFLCKDIEEEALQLPIDEMQAVLGSIIPSPELIDDANYNAMRDVIEHVLAKAEPIAFSGPLVAPDFDQKVEGNGLSKEVGLLLTRAGFQIGAVTDYFSMRSGSHVQDLRDHIADLYAKEKIECKQANLQADHVFFALLDSITPRSDTMKAAVQDAALVVLAYYFEACDVFEEPDAST